MKIFSRKNNRAASIIEYAVLIVMFLAAILLMQKQVARTFFGRWKDAGDTFSYGEQYTPPGSAPFAYTTTDCGRYVDANNQEIWYLQSEYEKCLDDVPVPVPGCGGLTSYQKRACCASWAATILPGICNF